MTVAEDKVVALAYELQAEGEIIETKDAANPLKFVFGSGQLLPEFEENIKGKANGEGFSFKLKPADAYGDTNPAAIVELPKSVFVVDGVLKDELLVIDNVIPMMDRNGHPLSGRVLSVGEETVKLDFNHPLAGKTLQFTGTITELREATQEEIETGYPEGMAPAGGCGCGDGGCGSGSCGDGGCGDDEEQGGGCGSGSCGCK